jgi:16S rRNA (cytidine1402-2'-O)-methyltransferase
VDAARARGFELVAIPGPSALAAAWSVSGMAGPGFLFYGFLPSRSTERRKELTRLSGLSYALMFYEAPHRVLETVRDLANELGAARSVFIARELTKVFESTHVCALGELAVWLEADANRQRGEFVLIVGPAPGLAVQHALGESSLRTLLEELPPAQAARLAAKISGAPRGPLYELAVRLRNATGAEDRE